MLGNPMTNPIPAGLKQIILGLGCFWGAERLFWNLPGIYVTAVGYAGGFTQNPTYEEVVADKPAILKPFSSLRSGKIDVG